MIIMKALVLSISSVLDSVDIYSMLITIVLFTNNNYCNSYCVFFHVVIHAVRLNLNSESTIIITVIIAKTTVLNNNYYSDYVYSYTKHRVIWNTIVSCTPEYTYRYQSVHELQTFPLRTL